MKEPSMIRFSGFDLTGVTRKLAMLAIAVSLTGGVFATADAQRRERRSDEQSDQNAADRVFSAAIGEIVQAALEQQEGELYNESIATLNRALASSSINPYERAVSLQLRGRAYYETDRVSQAIQDWTSAIDTGAMLPSEVNSYRINIGQLYITIDDFTRGIASLERAVADGGTAIVNAPLARMLAQAYGQAERYREGLAWADRFWAMIPAADRQRGDYSLMLFYYQQLEMVPQQMSIIEEMVNRWPTEKSNWQSYASLLAQVDREEDAFEANKIMYINGMFTEGREIEALAQYYSYFEYPYRGAVILEREMNSGSVERTQRNLNLLSNMWRQAREWERAIPVLRQVAQLSGDGDDYLKLAEALYQERQLSEAETAFQESLNRGGLDRPGTAWTLLGNVRLDLDRRQSALAAFQEGARYPYSRATATGYITYINGLIRAESDRVRIREQVRQDECRFGVGDLLETARLLGTVDEAGRIVVTIPSRCADLYNQFGEPIAQVAAATPAETAAEPDEAG
jgi:tetratricopeptide (TPR) repeat protein